MRHVALYFEVNYNITKVGNSGGIKILSIAVLKIVGEKSHS